MRPPHHYLTLSTDQWTRLEEVQPRVRHVAKPHIPSPNAEIAALIEQKPVVLFSSPRQQVVSTAPADLICRDLIERNAVYQKILHRGFAGLADFCPVWLRALTWALLWPLRPRTHIVYVRAPPLAPRTMPRSGKGPLRLAPPTQKRLPSR